MTAKYISQDEKAQAREWLHRYVQAGGNLTVKRYMRLTAWLNGRSVNELAEQDDVTPQAVHKSVLRDFRALQKFAKSKGKL